MPILSKKAFARLQEKWYVKLKKSGFEDAEELIGSEWHLKTNSSSHCRFLSEEVREARQAYFSALGECVNTETFDCSKDEYIMRRLAEGIQNNQIAAELIAQGIKCHRQSLCYIIRKYEMRWGIKSYPEDKLTNNPTGKKHGR